MQQQANFELMCPNHNEKIISVSLTETGENQMFCLKCFTQKQIPIEQLSQQLIQLNSQKIENLIEQGSQSEKRLISLKKSFLNVKEQLNLKIENIIKTIDDGIQTMNQNIKTETEQLKQSIQQLNLTQVNNYIVELKKQQLKNDMTFVFAEELRNKMIKQYLEFVEQLNQKIKLEQIYKQTSDSFIYKETTIPVKNIGYEQSQTQFASYKLFTQEKGIYNCLAMTASKNEQILVTGNGKNIKIWNYNSDGALKLNQILNGHTDTIHSLYFSRIGHWFISGSEDKSMRIWVKEENDQWICQQIIEDAHQDWVTGIILDNDEDQFISCSPDKTVKVWMKEKDGALWTCVQTMSEHTNIVLFLSLNQNCELLASNGLDRLRIWEKEKDKFWKQKQVIDNPNGDYHVRVQFIDDNELITSTKKSGRIILYNQNNRGMFQIKSEIKLNEIEEQYIYCFPIITNTEFGIVIIRHSNDYTYILKKQNNNYMIHQVLNGNYRAGRFNFYGGQVILSNFKNDSLDILK